MTDGTDADVGEASEVEQLRRDLRDAREEIVATNAILSAMGRSASDLDLVFGAIVDSARSLSRADAAVLSLVDGPHYRLARTSGVSAAYLQHTIDHPYRIDGQSLHGRLGLERRALQIIDVLADPDFGRQDAQRIEGFRSTMGAPMMLDDELIGVLLVWRTDVDPFDDRAVSLLTAFAAAAAIAVRNLDLVRALEGHSAELAHKVDQLEALGNLGEAVSSSLDLATVLATIVQHAVEMSGTDGGSLMEFDEAQQHFFVRTAYGTSDETLERLRNVEISLHDTFVGRSALEGRPLQIADLAGLDLDVHQRALFDTGWRSMVAVPMLREGQIVGVLVVRRLIPGEFPEETCELLQTFASQSALAILNARLFRDLEERTAELQVVSRHKSEFLASMSHELRTPLNAVIGFSEVLIDQLFGELNERQLEYLRDIEGSGKHLLQLINDILDLSKVEAGKMELQSASFSVREALEYGIAMMRERATRQGLSLRLDVAAEVDLVDADELRFKQVVINLLSNAVKFTPDGGTVTVGAGVDGRDVVVTVTDTGIGIAPADQQRIFESFQQGRSHATREGTGLGLSLCRRIVSLMGGHVWLESEVGVGSTFGFTVPIGSLTPADDGGSIDGDAAVDRVLVIEDDRPSVDLLTAYLESSGFAVSIAHDGAIGLASIRRDRPVAVILDVRLPGMDGWEVLHAIRSDPEIADLPVVVVSVLAERAKGIALGATEYLVKPTSRDDVLAALTSSGLLPHADAVGRPPRLEHW